MKRTLFFLAVAILFASCSGSAIETIDNDVLRLSVNGNEFLIDLRTADNEKFDVVSLNTEFPTQCQVENYSEFKALTINNQDATSGSCSFQLERIAEDEFIPIVYDNGNYSGTAYIRTRNSRIPIFTTTGTPVGGGDYYLSYIYLPLAMKLSNTGSILYYYIDSEPLESLLTNAGIWDFKKHVYDGKVYYSYHESDPAQVSKMASGFNPGRRVLMDEQYNVIDKFQLLKSEGIEAGEAIDGHDFYFFSPTHYIMSSYLDKQLSNDDFETGVAHKDGGCNVLAAYLQEVEDGKVVFEWLSTDHKELTAWGDDAFAEASVFDFYNTTEQRPDYVHFNSVDLDADGNLVCSFRHISSILKIDRAGGSGDIIWSLSGKGDDFNLSTEEHTCGQHFARINGNTLTLFDNGNSTSQTKYRTYTLNQSARTATAVACAAPGGYFTQACGSVSISDSGTYTVGCGMGTDMTNIKWLSEINASGEEVFSIVHPGKNVLSYTYRVVKIQ